MGICTSSTGICIIFVTIQTPAPSVTTSAKSIRTHPAAPDDKHPHRSRGLPALRQRASTLNLPRASAAKPNSPSSPSSPPALRDMRETKSRSCCCDEVTQRCTPLALQLEHDRRACGQRGQARVNRLAICVILIRVDAASLLA